MDKHDSRTAAADVAVVYHSAASYRSGIFRRLFANGSRYWLFSGTTSNQKSIRLMDSQLAGAQLQWTQIWNIWIGQFLIQPAVLLLPFERRWKCIIFLGNAYYLTTWIAAMLCRLTDKRVLMWTHGYRSPQHARRSAFKNAFFRLAHGLILYGRRGKQAMREQGFSEHSLYVGYNSLDYECHLTLRHRLIDEVSREAELQRCGIPQQASHLPTLIWVGRFVSDKRLPVLLDAVQRLRENGHDLNLILVGEGPERDSVRAYVEAAGTADSVYMPGAIYDEAALARLLLAVDLAISPGPVGVFAIHAMSFGLPVITCDDFRNQGPESEAIEPDTTGDFFRDGDAADLAAVILRWLENPASRKERQRACFEAIDRHYTPAAQESVIAAAVNAIPACELNEDASTCD